MPATNDPIPRGDRIDLVAAYLFAAFYIDSPGSGSAQWPPAKRANHLGWRRVAAAAIDLHLEGVPTP